MNVIPIIFVLIRKYLAIKININFIPPDPNAALLGAVSLEIAVEAENWSASISVTFRVSKHSELTKEKGIRKPMFLNKKNYFIEIKSN